MVFSLVFWAFLFVLVFIFWFFFLLFFICFLFFLSANLLCQGNHVKKKDSEHLLWRGKEEQVQVTCTLG